MNLSGLNFEGKLTYCLKQIQALLVSKNKSYGNSALEPSRIFSKADSIEQLKVRIDDKLSRITNQGFDDSEDTLNDLIGYLVLLKIALTEKSETDLFSEVMGGLIDTIEEAKEKENPSKEG